MITLVERFTTEYGSHRSKIMVSLFHDTEARVRLWRVDVMWKDTDMIMTERSFHDGDEARSYFDDWRTRLALTEATMALGLDR